MPAVSIIIPVYNLAGYIHDTVQSVLNQTFSDFELILVDDGSTDRSYDILSQMAEKDNRIILLQQQNAGQAAARNKGIDKAQGQYITFVDGDDLVTTTYLENLYQGFILFDAVDIVTVANDSLGEASIRKRSLAGKVNTDNRICLSGPRFLEEAFLHNGEVYSVSLWGKMYRASYIKQFTIPEGHFYEDLAVMPSVLYGARKIILTAVYDYIYLQKRPGSSITLMNRGKGRDILWALHYVKESLTGKVVCDRMTPFSVIAFNNVTLVVLWLLNQHNSADDQLARDLINKFNFMTLLKFNLREKAHLNRRGLILLITYRIHIKWLFDLGKRIVL